MLLWVLVHATSLASWERCIPGPNMDGIPAVSYHAVGWMIRTVSLCIHRGSLYGDMPYTYYHTAA